MPCEYPSVNRRNLDAMQEGFEIFLVDPVDQVPAGVVHVVERHAMNDLDQSPLGSPPQSYIQHLACPLVLRRHPGAKASGPPLRSVCYNQAARGHRDVLEHLPRQTKKSEATAMCLIEHISRLLHCSKLRPAPSRPRPCMGFKQNRPCRVEPTG